jgi:von Willebrand factor type A domain
MSSKASVKGVVDIVFLIDATGSMQTCIDALKENIATFLTSLTTKDANNNSPVRDWRAKVIGYRDFVYDKVPIEEHDFVGTLEELRSQLAQLKADGGQDEPESLLEGIFHVATMQQSERGELPRGNAWRHRSEAARIVIVFTDASFKEPLEKPKGAILEDVYSVIISNRIILSIFAPQMECYERLSAVDRSEWNVVEGGKDAQESMRLFTSDEKNSAAIIQKLAKTITKSTEVQEVPAVD